MTTYTNGSKSVKIRTEFTGVIRAAYIQTYKGEEQVLEFKSFNSIKHAEKWAIKMLSL